jgi:hypothetical protein
MVVKAFHLGKIGTAGGTDDDPDPALHGRARPRAKSHCLVRLAMARPPARIKNDTEASG